MHLGEQSLCLTKKICVHISNPDQFSLVHALLPKSFSCVSWSISFRDAWLFCFFLFTSLSLSPSSVITVNLFDSLRRLQWLCASVTDEYCSGYGKFRKEFWNSFNKFDLFQCFLFISNHCTYLCYFPLLVLIGHQRLCPCIWCSSHFSRMPQIIWGHHKQFGHQGIGWSFLISYCFIVSNIHEPRIRISI